MNLPSLSTETHGDDDAAPTLVIRTRVIDRRLLPPMPVQPAPIAPPAPRTAPLLQASSHVANHAGMPPAHAHPAPVTAHAPHAYAYSVAPAAPSADSTQPARRIRAESKAYRRLAIAFAIAAAFASGTAASFGVQMASHPADGATHDRQPRVALTRSASIRLINGADAKLELRDTSVSANVAPSRPAVSGAPRARGAKSAAAPSTPPSAASTEEASPPSADLTAGNLLDKGLSGD